MLVNTLTLLWAYAPIRSEKKRSIRNAVVSCLILNILRIPFYSVFKHMTPIWLSTVLRMVPITAFLYFYTGIDWKRCIYFSSLAWVGFTIASTIFGILSLSGIVERGRFFTGENSGKYLLTSILEHSLSFLTVTVLTRLFPMKSIPKIGKERCFLLGYVIFCEAYLVQMLAVTKASALGRAQPELTVYIILMQSFVIGGMLLFERYMAVSESRGKERMLDLAGQYRYEALQERQEAETDVRRLHHDMKNHLLALRSIENDAAKVDEYIEQMLDSLKKLEVLRRTGNELLDGLLTEKIRIAAVHGIEMTAELDFRPCSYTASKEDATHFVPVKTGDTKGRILIKGLEDDTYTMAEVRTDNGYVLLKQDIEVVISQKEGNENCTVYASDALGLIQNDPRYAQVIQSDADLKNIPQKHLEHKLLTASATVSGKNVNMTEDNGSANAEAPLTVVNTRGFDLPKTGDNGTMMFTIVGILLMVGAAAVLYAVSSKKSA